MDRKNWYFKQPVSYNDLDFGLSSGVEKFFRQSISEGGGLFGVVSDGGLAPDTGLAVSFQGLLAYDQGGRRITPYSGLLISQSLVSATDGTPTAVAASGNERWVSLFIKGGRKYTDSATDGSGNNVRATAVECLNALGDSVHPLGAAYDPVVAKEAGVDLLYVVVGTEDALGKAARPALIFDGVLLADVHLTYGQSTLGVHDIHVDRRQLYIGNRLRMDGLSRDLYRAGDDTDLAGPTAHTHVSGSSNLALVAYSGRGYVHQRTTISTADTDPTYVRYSFPAAGTGGRNSQWVPVVAPDASLPRQDLLVVTLENEMRVIAGTPAANPIPPATPNNMLALAEVRAMPGTTDTSTWPWVRASFRLLPYPLSTESGIVQGCRLSWLSFEGTGLPSATTIVGSSKNKIAFQGRVVEFDGGLDTDGFPKQATIADTLATPNASSSSNNVCYFIYCCRNQFTYKATTGFTSPVALIESLIAPNATGHPVADLGGPRGAIPAGDALVIGIGWMEAGSNRRLPVWQRPDGWFESNGSNFQVVNVGASSYGLMPSAPNTILVRAVRAVVAAIPSATLEASLTIGDFSFGGVKVIYIPHNPTVQALTMIGEYTLPGGPWFTTQANGVAFTLFIGAFQLELPRVTAGLE